jgi:endoglucanase
LTSRTARRRGGAVVVVATLVATLGIAGSALASPGNRHGDDGILDGRVRFYVEREANAGRQAEIWATEGRTQDAAYMRALSRISQAVWFTSGTPAEVRRAVHATVDAAQRQHAVPVLVAYYVPGRDCSQYSAGGAPGEQAYLEWIDAFARGIGHHRAVVILEPDGLALLSSEPWCGEGGGGFTGTPEDFGRVDERFREINGTLDRLARNRRTAVYVDAGHSAWQPLNDYNAGYGEPQDQLGMASRLLRGGIDKAQGFFRNVSNFRSTADLVDYGTRLSKCIAFRQATGASACSDADIASVPEDPDALTHFVLDTSRNGQGRGSRRPACTRTHRTGATRPSAASARGRPPGPATSWWTRSCG